MTGCPRCRRPLTEDGDLRYCDRCAYEPAESARLPATPPTEFADEAPASAATSEPDPRASDPQVA